MAKSILLLLAVIAMAPLLTVSKTDGTASRPRALLAAGPPPKLPAGWKKISCASEPVPGKPYAIRADGKVCGVWYDEIACQQVDGGSTFKGAPDVCCVPRAGNDWPDFSQCITPATNNGKSPVKCASTGVWKQKVCCVTAVCKA